MIQKFTPDINRDPFEEKAFDVFVELVKPLKSALKDAYENAYRGVDLGRALYNTYASPIRNIWNNPRTAIIYSHWHDLYMNLQTCDGLMIFINALYRNANPYFNIIAPLAIAMTVDINFSEPVWWNRDSRFNIETIPGDLADIDDDKEAQIFVTDNSTDAEDMVGIVFDRVAININDNAFIKILEDVIYPGLYYDVSIIK